MQKMPLEEEILRHVLFEKGQGETPLFDTIIYYSKIVTTVGRSVQAENQE